jgi:alpha-aminoadipate carrier protein LysW
MAVVRCPECETEMDIDLDEVEEGEIISCPECDVELEITQVHPLELKVIFDEEEEEDEDEDESGEDDDDDEDEEEDEELLGERKALR